MMLESLALDGEQRFPANRPGSFSIAQVMTDHRDAILSERPNSPELNGVD